MRKNIKKTFSKFFFDFFFPPLRRKRPTILLLVWLLFSRPPANGQVNRSAPAKSPPPITAVVVEQERVLLRPGTGFTGPTPEPAPDASHKGNGSDATAIARWDVVPWQEFQSNFNVGVVAFHINRIESVSFSVNDGPWQVVKEATMNPETKVVEYWATISAADCPDGLIEIRAIIKPVIGISRVLQGEIPSWQNNNVTTTNGEHSMWLFANSNKTFVPKEIYVSAVNGNDGYEGDSDRPFKTLKKALTFATQHDGARIILMTEGEYYPENITHPQFNNQRWVTVEAAPGLDRNQVQIVGESNKQRIIPRISRIRWRNLRFRPDTFLYINESPPVIPCCLWFDHCLFEPLEFEVNEMIPWRGNVYSTDSELENFDYGFTNQELCRNCRVKDTLDAFQRSRLVINCRIDRMRGSSLTVQHHPDVIQTWGDMKNVIYYGISGSQIDGTQIIFINQPLSDGPQMKDAAFVVIKILNDDPKGKPPASQLWGPLDHAVFRNVVIPNQNLFFRTDAKGPNLFRAKSVIFEKCRFYNRYPPTKIPRGVIFR